MNNNLESRIRRQALIRLFLSSSKAPAANHNASAALSPVNQNQSAARKPYASTLARKASLPLAFVALVAIGACQSANDTRTAEELKRLSNKIDALSEKVESGAVGAARPAAARPQRARPTVGELYQVPVHDDDPFVGGKHAKVTLVVASEFACPYCQQLATVVHELSDAYKEDELKVVAKPFVVHPQIATEPALASCAAAKQGAFDRFERSLWKQAWAGAEGGRASLQREGLASDALVSLGKSLGLDTDKLKADMQGSCKQLLARSSEEMRKLGVSGTPALYINGVYYGGPRTTEAIKATIDKELATANQALAKGQALEGYYRERTAKGKATL